MRENLISIITPTYNSQNFISEMLSSVISQTYTNWELIVVDDHSSDETAIIVEKFLKKDKRLKLIKLSKQSGPAYARNVAIKAAQGRYLTFLDSDDYWNENFLKYSLSSIKKHSFVYSGYNRISEDGKFINKSNVISVVTRSILLKGTPISCLTAFIDIKKLGKKYFPLEVFREDLGFWLSLIYDCKSAHGFNFYEANYRIHNNSSSSKKIKMAILTWKDYSRRFNLSLFEAFFFYVCYALNGLVNLIKLKFSIKNRI